MPGCFRSRTGGVDHGEVAGHVRFDEEVLVGRLDGLRDAADVGDGGGRRDGQGVGVAHADGASLARAGVPIEASSGDLQVVCLRGGLQELDGVDRQDALAPQRAFEARVAAALGGELYGGGDGVVAHGSILLSANDRFLRAKRNAQVYSASWIAHDAEADRAMAQVRGARLRGPCRS
jgi:hypothetical protein